MIDLHSQWTFYQKWRNGGKEKDYLYFWWNNCPTCWDCDN